jgi:hypothetical protein
MNERHQMVLVHSNGAELVFLCTSEGCGRRMVIDTRGGRLVVIDRGDETALHSGGTGQVQLGTRVEQGRIAASWRPEMN